MEKIIITGATGFIGSYLVKFLKEKGFKIIAHGSSNESLNILKSNLKENNVVVEDLEFWNQNFLLNDWNYTDFSEIDYLIHCAAVSNVREGTLENYDKYFKINVNATKKLAKISIDNQIKHFIYLSSGQVFGIPPSFPFTEETPKNPINLYGFTKLLGEMVVRSFGILGLKYTIARPFSVYGIGQSNILSIIKDKIQKNEILTVFGDGNQTRAFTHINDICKAIFLILNNPKSFNQEFNLSGPQEYTINDLIRLFSNKYRKEPKIEFKKSIVNEITRNIADTRKIRDLGLIYSGSLEDFINNEYI